MSDLDHDLDVNAIKADFPLLTSTMAGESHDQLITYLDSAASSQKPNVVIDTVSDYYRRLNANVARGVYELAEASTNAMEDARRSVARFVNAPSTNEIVFTRNATESINLVANTWGRQNLGAGDVVVLSQLEHHANIVPWQMLAAEKGFEIRWIRLDSDGLLDLSDLDRLLVGAKLLSVSAMSNVLGTLTPIPQLVEAAHAAGAIANIDACQFVPHVPTDVQAWGADFVSFSAHKMCGPTGVGALWGRMELLESTPPFLGGGGMILNVTQDGFSTTDVPQKFEAGT
ncbi:MAG TPA: aminotransferase class V-fold PLP-dependent enzyme, partial [Microthrixaceae bacterium]|nr:aminotransferase class V-fold PLP-dependent enzyme [Microthrixaceae bacterium]